MSTKLRVSVHKFPIYVGLVWVASLRTPVLENMEPETQNWIRDLLGMRQVSSSCGPGSGGCGRAQTPST